MDPHEGFEVKFDIFVILSVGDDWSVSRPSLLYPLWKFTEVSVQRKERVLT